MRKTMRCGLAVMVVAAALGAMVSGAAANRLSVSSSQFRVVWRSLIFKNTANTNRVLCPVTIEGSFHSTTIVKTVGSLIGFVTRASVKGEEPPCTGGTSTILSESLPWHITYEAYSGTLPSISSIHILLTGARFQVHQNNSLNCLATTEARHPLLIWLIRAAGGNVTGAEPSEEHRIPLSGEGGLCSLAEGFFGHEEVGTVSNGSGREITVTLI